LKTFKFDCNGNNAPAYGCDQPGDNSGEYFKAEDVRPLLGEVEKVLEGHSMSTVDWSAMRNIRKILKV